MEGPSIYLLAEKLQIFLNQKIVELSGNAKFEKQPLVGQTIQDIFAYGKKLIIQFEDHALTTHFLMYGSYRIDEVRANMPPRLALITKKHSLYFYNCSIKCFESSNVKKTLPLEFDILSEQWNAQKVIRAMKAHPKETIDDILLDQEIFAGVGNIIKNEVLFLGKVLPTTQIKKLSAKKIKEIVLHARQFSQKFLELHRVYQLKKNLQIYRKKYCPICKGLVTRKKTGTLNRWSFYCSRCQSKGHT